MLEFLARPAVYWSMVGIVAAVLAFSAVGLTVGWFDAGQWWGAVKEAAMWIEGLWR